MKYYTSTGEAFTESQIQSKLSKAYKAQDLHYYGCQSQGRNCTRTPVHHDHTIAKARCKVIHKTELIWDERNWVMSCNNCHQEHESYKSGLNKLHRNYLQRLEFIKQHDPEGYQKRINL